MIKIYKQYQYGRDVYRLEGKDIYFFIDNYCPDQAYIYHEGKHGWRQLEITLSELEELRDFLSDKLEYKDNECTVSNNLAAKGFYYITPRIWDGLLNVESEFTFDGNDIRIWNYDDDDNCFCYPIMSMQKIDAIINKIKESSN